MGTMTYCGRPPKTCEDYILSKCGMTHGKFANAIYDDNMLLVFIMGQQYPITLQNKPTVLDNELFQSLNIDISQITDIRYSNSIQTITEDAFMGMTALSAIKCPEVAMMESIPSGTFNNIPNLEVIELHSNLKTIGDNCFNGCPKIKKVKIPNSLESIGSNCFEGLYDRFDEVTFLPSFPIETGTEDTKSQCVMSSTKSVFKSFDVFMESLNDVKKTYINVDDVFNPPILLTVGDSGMTGSGDGVPGIIPMDEFPGSHPPGGSTSDDHIIPATEHRHRHFADEEKYWSIHPNGVDVSYGEQNVGKPMPIYTKSTQKIIDKGLGDEDKYVCTATGMIVYVIKYHISVPCGTGYMDPFDPEEWQTEIGVCGYVYKEGDPQFNPDSPYDECEAEVYSQDEPCGAYIIIDETINPKNHGNADIAKSSNDPGDYDYVIANGVGSTQNEAEANAIINLKRAMAQKKAWIEAANPKCNACVEDN